MENFALVRAALRKRGTENRNKQQINNERSEPEEEAAARAKIRPTNTETPAFADPLAGRAPDNKSRHQLQYAIRPEPAVLRRYPYPPANAAAKPLIRRKEVGRDASHVEIFLEPMVYNPSKDRGQESYLQSTACSPKKGESQELDLQPSECSPKEDLSQDLDLQSTAYSPKKDESQELDPQYSICSPKETRSQELDPQYSVRSPKEDRSQELYLQPTVYSPKKDQNEELDLKSTVHSRNNKEKGQQLYQKPGIYSLNDIQSIVKRHSKRLQPVYLRRACTEPHIVKATQAKQHTAYRASVFGNDLPFEYPELAPKPLAFQKSRRSKHERNRAADAAKGSDGPLNENRDADRLKYWQTFYSQDNPTANLNKEVDEYVGKLMFDRLLNETEMADTSNSTGYRSELVIRKYWESVRAYLHIDEDDEEE